MSKPWYSDCLRLSGEKLDKETFIKRFMPQYAMPYRSPTGIRTYKSKHTGKFIVQMTTPGSIQSQLTKRQNRIDAEYADYCQAWDATPRL